MSMTEQKVRALFELADITVKNLYRIENGYFPDCPEYAEVRGENPWWLVKTPVGLIKIGWRKRVILIDWEDTELRYPDLTQDDVTRDNFYVHAWSYGKAVNYLSTLGSALRSMEQKNQQAAMEVVTISK